MTTRADVAAHLGAWYEDYLSKIGRTSADNSANLGPVIDTAFRMMGVATAALSTATSDDEEGVFAQAEYHLMRLVVNVLGKSFDVSTSGDSFRLEQVWQHAKETLAQNEARVLELFGTTAAQSSDAAGFITVFDLNFLEEAYV